jgi:hypothetical protein
MMAASKTLLPGLRPDGKLYVSNFGAAPAGAGQIVRIEIP